MNAKSQIRCLIASCALSALPVAVMAQTTGTTTTTTTTTATTSTTVSADKLIQRYTKLAGSKDNATKLVTGLRDGSKEIQLSGSGSTSGTAITNPMAGRTMGYGNVNIVLAMAERQMAGDTSPTLQNVLTNPDNGILTLRASGMGWGQVANTLGFKLGEVMGNAPSKDSTGAAKKEERQSQRASRDAKGGERGGDRGQMARAERPEKIERPQKVERVERAERPQRPERGGGK
jgi:hypothetical protein